MSELFSILTLYANSRTTGSGGAVKMVLGHLRKSADYQTYATFLSANSSYTAIKGKDNID
jgi:hypothetical protein